MPVVTETFVAKEAPLPEKKSVKLPKFNGRPQFWVINNLFDASMQMPYIFYPDGRVEIFIDPLCQWEESAHSGHMVGGFEAFVAKFVEYEAKEMPEFLGYL